MAMKRGIMIWMSIVRHLWAVARVYFQAFLFVYLIVHLIFLAVDDARRHEPEAGEYDSMDVDGEMTMARACGIFLFSFIIQLQCLIIY